jgi:hypothetical protein
VRATVKSTKTPTNCILGYSTAYGKYICVFGERIRSRVIWPEGFRYLGNGLRYQKCLAMYVSFASMLCAPSVAGIVPIQSKTGDLSVELYRDLECPTRVDQY